MKGINSSGAALVHVPGWMDGWMGGWVGGWVGVKAVLRIAYSNQTKKNAVITLCNNIFILFNKAL
jgi:hypothetical protein